MKAVAALAAGVLVAAAAHAQSIEHAACEDARDASRRGDAVLQATYANCLVMGELREPGALAHARELGRASMKQGNPIGAYAVYAAFAADPAFSFMAGGKPDMAKYQALASLPVESRAEQIEALDALGFAFSKGYAKAMLSLAAYYYETVAPKNVARLRDVATAMAKAGQQAPYIGQFRKQAARIASLGNTKASPRAFLDAEKSATVAAHAYYEKSGAVCNAIRLLSVESGELHDAQFLPLQSPALHDTYLVKGSWDESFRFEGCGREARVKVHFSADGWGGAAYQTTIDVPRKP